MELYLIRHGESEINAKGIHGGWFQASLTQKGIHEAEEAGKRLLHGQEFDRVYSSDLIRARQTAEAALPGVTYEVTPLLREISVGALENRSADECFAEYGKPYFAHKALHNYRPYGGEDAGDVCTRAAEFLRLTESAGGERILAFTHEGFMRAMMNVICGTPYVRGLVTTPNCAAAVFVFRDGAWSLLRWNP